MGNKLNRFNFSVLLEVDSTFVGKESEFKRRQKVYYRNNNNMMLRKF